MIVIRDVEVEYKAQNTLFISLSRHVDKMAV